VAAAALNMPPALLPDGPVDYPLTIAKCWTVLDQGAVAYPVVECAVLPGQYLPRLCISLMSRAYLSIMCDLFEGTTAPW
jgi:hypothetical protein